MKNNNINGNHSKGNYFFTSESVAEGHPDKICDQISDAILDAYITRDPYSRVAVEALVAPNKVVVAGEISSVAIISKEEIIDIIRNLIKYIGYEQEHFHWQKLDIEVMLNRQSPDIALGVNAFGDKDEGAGDQGIMFGFACNETDVFMPAPIFYSHKILHNISRARHDNILSQLGPDAKSQVTLQYQDGKPIRAESIVVSIQHRADVSQKKVREMIRPYVISALPDPSWMCEDHLFYVNPTGKFIIGGPESDTGLTGRKIIVDTYGGAAPHGGGAFSGKDPSKVDRSAAYAVRYLAKNVVASGLADKCTIQVSYAIGVSKPLSFYLNTHGTAKIPENAIEKLLQELVDLSPRGIRTMLKLNRPIYKRTATYGHFGRMPDEDGGFSWEKTDLVETLRKELKAA